MTGHALRGTPCSYWCLTAVFVPVTHTLTHTNRCLGASHTSRCLDASHTHTQSLCLTRAHSLCLANSLSMPVLIPSCTVLIPSCTVLIPSCTVLIPSCTVLIHSCTVLIHSCTVLIHSYCTPHTIAHCTLRTIVPCTPLHPAHSLTLPLIAKYEQRQRQRQLDRKEALAAWG